MTTKYVKEINFELSEPVLYSFDGQLPKTSKLVLKAPKIRHFELPDFIDIYNRQKALGFLCRNELIVTNPNGVALDKSAFSELDFREVEALYLAYGVAFLGFEDSEEDKKKAETV